MKTNVSIVHPLYSVIKFFSHLGDEKLESKVFGFNEVEEFISNIKSEKALVNFKGRSLRYEKRSLLDFVKNNFQETKNQKSVIKHEKFKIKDKNMNYLFFYKNNFTLANEDSVIFMDYLTPLRGFLVYYD